MLSKYDFDTFSPQIPESSSHEIFNSIVRIETISGKATGFFLKIKIRDRELNSLVTNCHVISKEFVSSKSKIFIFYGNKENEIKKIITLDSFERYIRCFDWPKDITIIEIKNYDYIPDHKFLLPDLNYKNGYYQYYTEKFYLAGYPGVNDYHRGERHISSGLITNIYGNNFEFEHSLDRRKGSSGSPICLLKNNKVVGVHKSSRIDYDKFSINKATFIGVVIDYLENEYYLLPKINNFDDYKFDNFGLAYSQQIKPLMDINYFHKVDNYIDKTITQISNMMDKTFSFFEKSFMNMNLSNFDENKYTISNEMKYNQSYILKEKKINFNRSKTPISNNNSFIGSKISFTESNNYINSSKQIYGNNESKTSISYNNSLCGSKFSFIKSNNYINSSKQKYDNNRSKTPISYNNSLCGDKKSLTNLKKNNESIENKLNKSLLRLINKSCELKLKRRQRKKKKQFKADKTNNNNLNNISCYSFINDKKSYEISTNSNYNFKFKSSETNKKICLYRSKSYDVIPNREKKNNNVMTVDFKQTSKEYQFSGSNYCASYSNYKMFSSVYI